MKKFSESEKSEIIELALSDHASFENIKTIYGIGEKLSLIHISAPTRPY